MYQFQSILEVLQSMILSGGGGVRRHREDIKEMRIMVVLVGGII